MKKILALLLVFVFLFSFASCEKTYKAEKSTKEESRVVYKLTFGKKTYEVKYELYRFFYLTYRDGVFGDDTEAMAAQSQSKKDSKIEQMILDSAAEIYSVFALCDELGIDLYSKDTDKQVEELLKVNVEGGAYNGEYYEGFESYDAYLDSVKASGGNYAVADLLFRYAIGITTLNNYYAGLGEGLGNLTPSDEELETFFEKEDTARVLFVYFDREIADANPSRVTKILTKVQTEANADALPENKDTAIGTYLLGQMSNMAESDVRAGEIITPYSLDRVSYGEVADVAASLCDTEVSELFEIVTEAFDGYYFIYRMSKPAGYLSENRDRVIDAYIADYCGNRLYETKTALLESAEATKVLDDVSYQNITPAS